MLIHVIPFYFYTAHSAYFAVFEASKKALGADQDGHHPIQAGACGSMAAVSHDMFITPFDTVKQRMQLGYYKNVIHCIRTVLKTEGVGALYTSFPTTLMMNIPFGAVMMAVNESMKKIINPDGQFSTGSSMLSGSVAGAIAAAATNPLDVVKTRLQTQNLEHCTKSCEDPHFNVPGATPAAVGAPQGPTARKHVPKSGGGSTIHGYPRAKYRKNTNLRPSYFITHPTSLKFSSDALSIKQSGVTVNSSSSYRSSGQGQGLGRRLLCAVSCSTRRPATSQRMRGIMTLNPLPRFRSSGNSGSGASTKLQLSRYMCDFKTAAPAASPVEPPRTSHIGMIQMVKRIYADEGARGFARGMVPRMMVHAPSVAISWTAYEAMKSILMDRHD